MVNSDLAETEEYREERRRINEFEWQAIVEEFEEKMEEWESRVDDFFSLRKVEETLSQDCSEEEQLRINDDQWQALLEEKEDIMEERLSAVANYFSLMSL